MSEAEEGKNHEEAEFGTERFDEWQSCYAERTKYFSQGL